MKTQIVVSDSALPAWQQEFKGLHWQDMPGPTDEDRKMNFYLFRVGKYDPEMDVVEPDKVDLQETEDEESVDGDGWRSRKYGKKIMRTRTGKLVLKRRASAAMGSVHERKRRLATVQARARRLEMEQSEEYAEKKRWHNALKAQCAELTPHQCYLVRKNAGAASYSALKRLLGLDVSRGAVKLLRDSTLQSVGAVLESLKVWEAEEQAEAEALRQRKQAVRVRIQRLKDRGLVHLITRLERLTGINYRLLLRMLAGSEARMEPATLDSLEKATARLEENPDLEVPKPRRKAAGLTENNERRAA